MNERIEFFIRYCEIYGGNILGIAEISASENADGEIVVKIGSRDDALIIRKWEQDDAALKIYAYCAVKIAIFTYK